MDLPGNSGAVFFDGYVGCQGYEFNDVCEELGGANYNGEGKANDKCCTCGGGTGGDCYEAYLPDFPECSDYTTQHGFACVGDYCSVSQPGGDFSNCAVLRDGCVDRSTGKCSTEGMIV
jgi:hypothetical protein